MSQDKNLFVHETEVYNILKHNGMKVPKFGVISPTSDVKDLPFKDGEPIVIKGLGLDLWHKSDEGALHFAEYSEDTVLKINETIKKNIAGKYEWIETLICEKVPFQQSSALPSEAFISIQREDSCGYIISFGIGGIHAEAWAQELGSGVLMWPVSLMTPEQALEEFKVHWLGKVWLGTLRQGKALTTEAKMKAFIEHLWAVAKEVKERDLKLLEMNPMVLDQEGNPIALDGVALRENDEDRTKYDAPINADAILNPKKIAVAGVSDKASSFGKKILDNLISSDLGESNLKVIKPGIEKFQGIECYADVSKLIDNPVDALILALPAKITVETLKLLCEQGGGAEVVYLVAGGLGDGADTEGYGKQVKELLHSRRKAGLWTPALIGPNSLGIVLSPKNVSTLFISKERLPINFKPNGNIGLVSQSGAFFITRLSNDDNLPIKYGFCIGNQMDIKVSDFVDVMAADSDISVIGAYSEGFDEGDAIRFAEKAKELIAKGKHIVLYKGGRSTEGQAAAAGHTGSMAGNYDLQKRIFVEAGIVVTESFDEYASVLRWLSAYPNYKHSTSVAVISNAGYETVGSADHLGEDKIKGKKRLLMTLEDADKTALNKMIEENKLTGLVSAANPFDITPMAGDKAYLDATRVFAAGNADAVIVCVVPLSDMLGIFDDTRVKSFVAEIKKIASESNKPVGVVVDSGKLYDDYRQAFAKENVPVYRSIETAFSAIKNVSKLH